jgi:hypothetical protein
MKPNTVAVPATSSRPNRILVALAAAWMILSLAIGGAVTAETPADATNPSRVTSATAP